MNALPLRPLALGILLLGVNPLAGGGQAASGQDLPVKESLPEGAVARLGDARFKNFGRPFALTFAPDSKHLAVGCWDGMLSYWNLDHRELLFQWEGHVGPIHAVAISPDGKTLASAGADKEIRVWKMSNCEQTQALTGNQAEIKHLLFSPDGSLLASSDAQSVALWDLATERPRFRLNRYSYRFGARTAFADRSSLAFVSEKYDTRYTLTIETVDVRTGKEKNRLEMPLQPTGPRVYGLTGKWLVQLDRGMQAMHLPSQRESRYLDSKGGWTGSQIAGLAMAPDERCVAIASDDQRIAVVELASGLIRNQFRRPERSDTSLALSPDGRFLASGSVDRSVYLWDLTGRPAAGKAPPVALAAVELDRLWNDLDSSDGAAVQRAIWTLAAGAKDSVAYLGTKLLPVNANPERVATLIRELEDNNFKVRVRAETELEKLRDEAETALKKILGEAPSLESRRRIEKLIERMDNWWNKCQMLRGIEALERSDTPEARQMLQRLAQNQSSLRRAEEAGAALRRLNYGLGGASR